MKVKDLIKQLHCSILLKDAEQEKKIWLKLLKKSLKHKKTYLVK